MDNYIRVYKNVISDEKCQHLIKMFESDTENHEIQDNGNGATLTTRAKFPPTNRPPTPLN